MRPPQDLKLLLLFITSWDVVGRCSTKVEPWSLNFNFSLTHTLRRSIGLWLVHDALPLLQCARPAMLDYTGCR